MTDAFSTEALTESAHYNSAALGPEYFEARMIAQRFMQKFQDEHFKALTDDFAAQFQDRLWTDIAASLLCDTESNLQLEMARMVRGTVEALLTGERWALERYPLANDYDGPKIRAAIIKHCSAEFTDARVADLEKQVASLTRDLEWARQR